MGFHNIKLPDDIALGFEGGPGLNTIVQTTASGHEYRVSRQAAVRHRFRPTKELLTLTQFATLKAFWVARRGSEHGFRFKDWADFTTAVDGSSAPSQNDVVLGTGDASRTQFQLIKTYDPAGLNPYARVLTLPVAGSVLVALDGSPTSAWSLTNPGGVITFDSAPGASVVVSAGCQFEVPVRFGEEADRWLRARYTDFQRLAWEEFECVEILNETEWPETRWPGGSAAVQVMSVDLALNANEFFWPLDPTLTGLNAFLPPPDRIPGGEVFVVHVISTAAGNVTVRDDAGAAVTGSLSSGQTRRIALSRSGATANWIAYP